MGSLSGRFTCMIALIGIILLPFAVIGRPVCCWTFLCGLVHHFREGWGSGEEWIGVGGEDDVDVGLARVWTNLSLRNVCFPPVFSLPTSDESCWWAGGWLRVWIRSIKIYGLLYLCFWFVVLCLWGLNVFVYGRKSDLPFLLSLSRERRIGNRGGDASLFL